MAGRRARSVRLTGEQPVAGSTPDSILALHRAGYREVRSRLGQGLVLDVGCGLGGETARLAGEGRRVVGLERDAGVARSARASHPELAIACGDAAHLGIRSASVDAACSSHVLEHLVHPADHVAEMARVLRPDGVAFFLTPNRPADFENPFHVRLFGPEELGALLGAFFLEVVVHGLEGSPRAKADLAGRRARARRLLRLDVLDVRHRVPRGLYQRAYATVLPLAYGLLARGARGGSSGIDEGDYALSTRIEDDTPVLVGVARFPRASLEPGWSSAEPLRSPRLGTRSFSAAPSGPGA
jgi:SAM-dependent methyltransferase